MGIEQARKERQREDEVRKVMSRRKQITSLRNAIFNALGDAVDIKEIMNSLGGLSNRDIKTLRDQLKTTKDAISILKQYDAISKYLNSLKPGKVRYGSTYTPVEYRKKNTTQEALSRFYANQSAEEYLKRSKERRAEQWERFSENRKRFYEDLEANRPLSSIRDTSNPSGISYGSDLDDITYRTSEQEALRDDYRRREAQTIENKERRHEANRLARERYTDAIESINDPFYLKRKELYNRFLEVDPNTGISTPQQKEEASAKAREVLRLTIEKKANEFVNNNNKETSKNTQALSVLNKRLFPFLSYFMPAGILGMGMSTIREDVSTSRTGLSYRNFTEAYLNSREGKRKYKAFEDMYFSQGGQWQGAKKAFSREADWISNVRFGYGRERIRDLAIRGLKIPNEIIRTGDISGLMDYYASVIPKMSPEQYKLLKSSGLLDETMLFGFRNANRPWGGKERISHLSGSAEKYLATTPFGQRGSWIGERVSNTIGYWLSATLPSWVLSAPNMTPTVSDMFHGRFFYDPYEDPNRRTTVNPIINQNITVGTPEEANRISGERMAEAMISTLPNAER